VFQDPYASLDPRMRVGSIIAEPLVINEPSNAAGRRHRVGELWTSWDFPRAPPTSFPTSSRAGSASASPSRGRSPCRRSSSWLDEPVSALDVSIRAQILNLLRDLQTRLGVSYLFISHDLAAVAHMSHAIAVMYLGKIVELGDAAAIALEPKHPYTKALFAAALPIDFDTKTEDVVLDG
jgi:ABC-type microcin C transport system duplicated ATPase subunit YejF